ncbi:MAG: AAA family ATPase [Nitrospira sp.]|nr:AAA family ATPase [Nitrospira sp.]
MKLLRLLLQAFGPFTNKVVDFSAGPNNLHLIYGPNEAGKSSALRAMTDLRFGIPVRSTDSFVHAPGDLRIAGVFLSQTGQSIGFVRRKGKGNTLSRLNVKTEQPDPALPIDSTLERELTGGLERADFESMFGLNHARLREGGRRLLAGEGDLGSALFEASAGTRGITVLLADLDTDAKKRYSSHGRAQNAVINEARRQIEEQRQVLRQALTKPADWQVLNRAHETAKTTLDEISQALELLRRRENDLTELRTVEPSLREHDRLATELQSLADTPNLAEHARQERLTAQQSLTRAQQDLREAEQELERCSSALAALALEPLVLQHADTIERWLSQVAAVSRHHIEVQQQAVVIEQRASALEVLIERIAPGIGLSEVLRAIPSDADRKMLDTHVAEVARLGERLQSNKQQAESIEEALRQEADTAPVSVDPVARQALSHTIRHAQSLGDVGRRKTDLDRQVRDRESLFAVSLADLSTDSEQVLRASHPILDAQITLTKQELLEVQEQQRIAGDEYQRVERDLDEQRLRYRQLAAEGEVVTSDTLRSARLRRDQGWALIRQAYIERTQDAESLTQGFDTGRPLPEAFEAAEHEADRQADLLRADAKRAAGFEECAMRIEQMEARRSQLQQHMDTLAMRRREMLTGWGQRLCEAGLPDFAPEPLQEWQRRRQDALQLADQAEVSRTESASLAEQTREAASCITNALQTLGQPVDEHVVGDPHNLTTLIDQGLNWEKSVIQIEAEQSARAKTVKQLQAERAKVHRAVGEITTELDRHRSALQQWEVRLHLSAQSTPDAVKARLNELDELARQHSALTEAQDRKALLQAELDALTQQGHHIAELLGEDGPVSLTSFADSLHKRLVVAREKGQERDVLLRDQGRAFGKKGLAESEQATQEAVYARLCTAAGTTTVDALPELEEAAARKREVKKKLAFVQDQLARASSHSEEELRTRLAGRDAFALDHERDRCRSEIEQREQELVAAQQNEQDTRLALNAVDTSDRAAVAREAIESAAARYRSAIRPWARLKLASVLLQEALDRFRERAQAPMITATSAYFSLMTGGAYERLATDESGDKPVLCAQRAGGARIRIEEMSEGTGDQLYLALRLAALELRRSSHPQMPLILDDVLITSDNDRAANVLRALSQFSEGGQVMIFTHHEHLIEVARSTLGEHGFVFHEL